MSMEKHSFIREPLLKGKGTVDLLVKMACLVKHLKTLRHFAEYQLAECHLAEGHLAECHLADTVKVTSVN